MLSIRCLTAAALAGALWTLGGTAASPALAAPIVGAPNPDAGTPLTDGTWTDQLGAYKADNGKRYYQVTRTAVDQTVFVGAVAAASGTDGFRLKAGRRGENNCLSTDSSSNPDGVLLSTAGSVFDGCGADLSTVVGVERRTASEQAQPQLGLALRRVTVPRPRNYEQLPELLPEISTETLATGSPTALTAARDPAAPTPIRDATTVALRLNPGEVVFLETEKVDWGRHLSVQADVAADQTSPEQLEVRVLGPAYSTAGSDRLPLAGSDRRAAVTTKPVVYRSYQRYGSNLSYLAGRHLIAVGVTARKGGSDPVQVTVTSRIGGEARGVPDFGGVAVGPDQPPAWKSWAPWTLGAIGLGCWVAAAVVWLRRR